jgi:hypothetical protein
MSAPDQQCNAVTETRRKTFKTSWIAAQKPNLKHIWNNDLTVKLIWVDNLRPARKYASAKSERQERMAGLVSFKPTADQKT